MRCSIQSLRNRRGLTILTVLIASVLVAMAGVLLSKALSTASRTTARLDRQQLGDQVLVSTASALQRSDFEFLLDLCNTKNAFPADVTGTCVAGTALNPAATVGSGGNGFQILEVLRNWAGDPSAAGTVCIELNRCKWLLTGSSLEMTLKGYWPDTNPNTQGLVIKTLALRRARW